MVTRCPSCATLFRVTAQHLQAYHGQVRCGRCMTVFDAFKALATLPDQGAPDLKPRSAAESAAARGEGNLAPARADVASIPAAPVPASPLAIPEAAAAVGEPAHEPIAHVIPASPELTEGALAAPHTVVAPEEAQREARAGGGEREHEAVAESPHRRVALGWSVGVALTLLALGGQALYAYRVELAANHPGLKPVVDQLCDLLGCSVPLPQRPKLITIEASDLQVQDPLRPGVIQLTATLRNHAGFEVGYPALDLVLTNTKEHTLARRIFLPEEYLDKGRNASAGLPANAEITVRLVLDTGELGAAGFRLALLPAR